MRYINIVTKLFAITLVLTSTACSQISLRTAWSLRNLDYLTVDTEQARLAISLPKGALLDEATLTLKFKAENEPTLDHLIQLEIIDEGPELLSVGYPDNAKQNLVLRVPASQLQNVRHYQSSLKSAQDHHKPGSATLGIGSRLNQDWLRHYCDTNRSPTNPSPSLPIQAWIKIDNTQGYLELFEEDEIFQMLAGESLGICSKDET